MYRRTKGQRHLMWDYVRKLQIRVGFQSHRDHEVKANSHHSAKEKILLGFLYLQAEILHRRGLHCYFYPVFSVSTSFQEQC